MTERGTSLSERVKLNNLGEMLRLYRAVHQWTLREMAADVGIGHATLMRIEHGEAFDIQTFLKLWNWFLANSIPLTHSK